MDRYAEVKLLLKRWEGDFLREHERRPTKADIENAAEETQNLYREYRVLKQKQQANESMPCVPDVTTDQAPEREEPDSWGSHLNRAANLTPKMTSSERASLKASAQYYGMKLKSNLGGAGKVGLSAIFLLYSFMGGVISPFLDGLYLQKSRTLKI